MAEKLGIYKCEKCGNIAEVLHAAKPPMSCCNQPMTLMTENTVDAALEKHVPVIEKIEGGYLVKVAAWPIPWKRSTSLSGLSSTPTAWFTENSSTPATNLKRSS